MDFCKQFYSHNVNDCQKELKIINIEIDINKSKTMVIANKVKTKKLSGNKD